MQHFDFDPTNLQGLIKESGMTCIELSRLVGISDASLFKYQRGEASIGLKNALVLADFFAVPLDFLLGRCDEKTARDVLKNYSRHFMQLRRGSYEDQLRACKTFVGRESTSTPRDAEPPWPYNIVGIVNGNTLSDKKATIDYIITKDHERKIIEIIGELKSYRKGRDDERIRKCLLMYYRDGMTLKAIGDHFGVTTERIRRIVIRGIWMLRHHPLRDWFVYGEEHYVRSNSITELTKQLSARELDLELKKKRLDALEEELNKRELALYKRDRKSF